ncbi:ribosome-binding factor A [Candidatus Methylomirabilis lanthanidiphila]|uniref:Ribosome-binding factor A n=1 Tax=Candidatus Methylomirabilis lanthanidiphila TaxID=2211376 RepID=A0A564ZH33_9BACT|nr:30S ribosome-binding factor RbfA [Candidatus Methylomirabilis lanthanidiphila]VUZ84436.1 ribosome-binding factor A [Candidatus Methylomirabilis lanthanidiphila]
MQGRRADRISTLIQEEISRLILQSVKDPRIRCVTVTRVRVSDDLRCAKIYIAPMGDGEQQRREALAGLTRAGGFLRGELGRRLCLRYVPELDFLLDDSLEQELHLAELFRQIEATGTKEP